MSGRILILWSDKQTMFLSCIHRSALLTYFVIMDKATNSTRTIKTNPLFRQEKMLGFKQLSIHYIPIKMNVISVWLVVFLNVSVYTSINKHWYCWGSQFPPALKIFSEQCGRDRCPPAAGRKIAGPWGCADGSSADSLEELCSERAEKLTSWKDQMRPRWKDSMRYLTRY